MALLHFRDLGINTRYDHVVFLRSDSPICISEGFEALARVRVFHGDKSIVATLNMIDSDLLQTGEISLSTRAAAALEADDGDHLRVSHLPLLDSMGHVRSKIYGQKLSRGQVQDIVRDIAAGNYGNVQLSAFITACAGENLSIDEIVYLTEAMISSGNRLQWNRPIVADKHCIGGLPGNRTTPIVVAIGAAAGLTMPKTSSRAITSPAGTADTMETITEVQLSLAQMRQAVENTGAVLAWGGSATLSPADDILIRVERVLDLDSEGQLIASVLSKKAAAGSTHVIIDMPVGSTAKLRTREAAESLMIKMESVASMIGLKLKCIITDGSAPVGRGIGPNLEALDVLAVLGNEEKAPEDLRERSLLLAGELLELTELNLPGTGMEKAREILKSGRAMEKFREICKAQGRFTIPSRGHFCRDITAEKDGTVVSIDNRQLARIAKFAGAPFDKAAGIEFFSPPGKKISKGDVLFRIYAQSEGELNYALEYWNTRKNTIVINGKGNES